jgi:hypothetical protein
MPFGGVKGSGIGRFGGKAAWPSSPSCAGSRCRRNPGTIRSEAQAPGSVTMFVLCAARMRQRPPSRSNSQEKRPLRGARGVPSGSKSPGLRVVVLPHAVVELRGVHGGMHALDFGAAFPVTAQHVDEVNVRRQQRRHARHVVSIPRSLPFGGDDARGVFKGCRHGRAFSRPA